MTVPLPRRTVLALGAAAIAAPASRTLAAQRTTVTLLPAQTRWQAEPVQAPAREGLMQLPDVALWCWDTGGPGEPVILLHPATGSSATWPYQQPVLAAAGYRVIGYSRRGHYRSEAGPAASPGTASGDLHNLVEALGLGRFHLVGSALGGFALPDYALSHPDRVASMVIASSLIGLTDPDYAAVTQRLRPQGFDGLPPEFRELGPSYRAGYPAGVERWKAQEGLSGPTRPPAQATVNTVNRASLARIRTPVLLLTGDADLYQPPSRVRELVTRFPHAEAVVIAEAGHAPHWEQPLAFNAAVVGFLRRHGWRRGPG